MCGICGYMQKEDIKSSNIIQNMKNSILRRGKSENNIYIKNNVALGHARLSIIDVKNGKQPMEKIIHGKRYVISYNGELYNTQVLKNICVTKGIDFKTECDTEVLLALYIIFGKDMLKYVNGIFAFAIYDEDKKMLFLAKDRLGIKPLFYTLTSNNTFIFSSEIKGILSSNIVSPVLGKNEALELFALGPAHSPGKTYFKNIYELEAGSYIIFKDFKITKEKYWDLEEKKLNDNHEEIVQNVKYLVSDATKRQLVSNVGMSSMLSGGIDSSIVTKVASDNIYNLNTYSINYEDNDKDFTPNDYQQTKDSDFVKIMVKYLNTSHHDITVTNDELYDYLYDSVISRDMPGMADVDSSMYIFCKEISKHEKVILSGECSDEIFGGYPWFYKEHLKNAKGFPWALSENLRKNLVKDKNIKENIEDYICLSKNNTLKNINHISHDTFENEYKEINYLTIKYFMNTLVERTDRMSMANSLEVRVPFADHRIFEYIYNISAKEKLGLNNSSIPIEKAILKEAFKNDIPSSIISRKKSPFPKTYSKYYLKKLENKLNEIIKDEKSRLFELVDKNYVLELLNSHGSDLNENLFGQLMTYPQTIAFLIQIDFWLKAYNIKIELNN